MSMLGGGAPPATGANGSETLEALLKVITDPEVHRARLAALQDATAASAKAADGLARKESNLKADREEVIKDRLALDKEASDFALEKRQILDKVAGFARAQADQDAREKAVKDQEAAFAGVKAAFEDECNTRIAALNKRETDLKDWEADLDVRKGDVEAQKSALAAAQLEFDNKLTAIRALAK